MIDRVGAKLNEEVVRMLRAEQIIALGKRLGVPTPNHIRRQLDHKTRQRRAVMDEAPRRSKRLKTEPRTRYEYEWKVAIMAARVNRPPPLRYGGVPAPKPSVGAGVQLSPVSAILAKPPRVQEVVQVKSSLSRSVGEIYTTIQ